MNKKDISKRYKNSIIIDNLLFMTSTIIMIVALRIILKNHSNLFVYIYFGSFIISAAIFVLFSDVIFLGRSLGKRIYHIQNNMNNKTDITTYTAMCLYRRILEATIHPWFVSPFEKRAEMIDEKTNTKIELCK